MSQQSQQYRVLEEATIVDADVHLTVQTGALSEETLSKYVDQDTLDRVKSASAYPQSYGADHSGGGEGRIEYDDRLLTSSDRVEQNVREDLHIDHPILNNNPGLQKLPDTDLARELMPSFNNYMIAEFLDDTDYLALAGIAQQDPHAAAEEIDRVADEDGIIGIYLGSTGPQKPLGHPDYFPIYEAAADNDLAVAYHGGAGDKFRYDFQKQHQGLRRFMSVHSIAHLWSQSLTLASLLAEGVPDRFPSLNFVFLESGLTWVPHVLWQLNAEYEDDRTAPNLDRPPEAYLGDSFYFSSQPLGEPEQADQMQEMIELIGTDAVMFASDYPHWDFDHPMELDKHLQHYFTEAQRNAVLWETPVEAFGLDIER